MRCHAGKIASIAKSGWKRMPVQALIWQAINLLRGERLCRHFGKQWSIKAMLCPMDVSGSVTERGRQCDRFFVFGINPFSIFIRSSPCSAQSDLFRYSSFRKLSSIDCPSFDTRSRNPQLKLHLEETLAHLLAFTRISYELVDALTRKMLPTKYLHS